MRQLAARSCRSPRASAKLLAVALSLLAWLLCGSSSPAHAHPLSPPSLAVHERAPAHYEVSFRRSRLAATRLELAWPRTCTASPATPSAEGDQVTDTFTLRCQSRLEGQTVRVFGLVELELSVLVYLELLEAEPVRVLLSAERSSFVVPTRPSSWDVLRDYVELGTEHLLSGPDHILFVLGLMLLVRGLRGRLLALTAFTLGHSVTLCLSALSVVRLPQPPVEIGIAASLLVLALEVLEQHESRPSTSAARARRAGLMASGFGLLHGLGFASALIDSGLPPHAVPLSLFAFNLGVELGQLLVVLLLAPCLYLVGRLSNDRVARVRAVAAYTIGGLAAMWCIERTLTLFHAA